MELVYMYAWGAYALRLEGSSPFLSIFSFEPFILCS